MANTAPDSPTTPAPSQFIFVICQNGAESATKLEVTNNHPNLNLAFSRPGFITFKVSADNPLPQRFTLKSALARTYGWSLGKCTSQDASSMVAEISTNSHFSNSNHVHVWQRDPFTPGKNGFEPGISALANEVGNLFKAAAEKTGSKIAVNKESKPDDQVFDVVMVEPNEWWYGYHFASTVAGRWPGGTPAIDTSVETYSRAYFKLSEALLWSGITIQPGDICAEIGSAPGGACQLLLEKGASVIGIDPAEMETGILEHENFVHIRKRGTDVRRKEFRNTKWLLSDLNADPNFSIETVAEIVNHPLVDVKGIILTLKFSEWKNTTSIPDLMKAVKALGFQVVKARQLAFNRREICLVAVKDKFVLRLGKKNVKTKKPATIEKPSP
ncbi:MAG: hypothetical protein GY880_10610 [Planctomycetaceae bacterium]|nr:hypothetical protein [Planctomycetaceae bacterium]MCP4774681.1 hypothetical protein [Planctomycetaceae bacterium]